MVPLFLEIPIYIQLMNKHQLENGSDRSNPGWLCVWYSMCWLHNPWFRRSLWWDDHDPVPGTSRRDSGSLFWFKNRRYFAQEGGRFCGCSLFFINNSRSIIYACMYTVYIYNALKSYKAMEHLRFWTLQFTFFFHIRVWVRRSDAKVITSSISSALEIHKGVWKAHQNPKFNHRQHSEIHELHQLYYGILKRRPVEEEILLGKCHSWLPAVQISMGQSSMPQQGLCEEGGTAAVGLECPVHNSQKLGIFCWPKRGGRKA